MTAWINQFDAWVTALCLLLGMLTAFSIGWYRGRRIGTGGAASWNKVDDASLALMGLLLGFTFAMALQKHDQRRLMVITDSNAIGDFYTCVSMLKEPLRGRLHTVIRDYVGFRLQVAREGLLDDATVDRLLAQVTLMQNEMTGLVRDAVNEGTPVTVPLVNTLNEVTSANAARLAASRDRLPGNVVVLLFIAAIVATGLLGRQQGVEGKLLVPSTIGFVVMVGFSVFITLDLNQLNRGLIQVSQEPLEKLLTSMGKSP